MKIFISWSGETSRNAAHVLGKWLPYVIQSIKPFVSDSDIAKGERWSSILAHELEDTQFGIICVTPYNIRAPWLYFESGAISKSIDHSCVMPFLFRVDRQQLHGPLSQFQSTVYEQGDLFNLFLSINNKLAPAEQLDQERLSVTFNQWWPQIRQALDDIPNTLEGGTQTGYEWLYTPGDLAGIELDVNCKNIWVVTPSPYQDIQLTCVKDVVRKNIERGVQYTFIMPSSAEVELFRGALQQLFSDHASQLHMKEIDLETFQSLAVTHYIALSPEKYNPRVLLELPVAQRDYWIEVSGDAAYSFVARFHHMLEGPSSSVIQSTEATPIATQPVGLG